MSTKPPEKGDEIVLRQVWLADEFGPNSYDEDGLRRWIRRHIRATVVYVRTRGDFDVEAGKDCLKLRVRPSGDASGYARGDVCALRWRGKWLHPDQLPQLLEAEASGGSCAG